MSIETLNNHAASVAATVAARQANPPSMSRFADEARDVLGEVGDGSTAEVVRKGAEELVAAAFVQPLFAMMREDPLRADFLPLSQGEKTFGPMLDAELSKRIVSSARFDLVDAVARHLLKDYQMASGSATPAPDAQITPNTYA